MNGHTDHKTKFMGIGGGVVLFVLVGLLPGIYLGGTLGVTLAGILFGASAYAGIFRELMAASGMMLGITVGGLLFVGASSIIGWFIGLIAAGLTRGHGPGGPSKGMLPPHDCGGSLPHNC